jgi:hypothetical protein
MVRLEFSGPLSRKDWRFPFKRSKDGPEKSKRIVCDHGSYTMLRPMMGWAMPRSDKMRGRGSFATEIRERTRSHAMHLKGSDQTGA